MSDLTLLLEKIHEGSPQAADELLSRVYEELRQMAKQRMASERPGHTLQPTILVHDAWLRLFPEGQNPKFEGRAHFFAAAATAMRRILVEHARRSDRAKRPPRGGQVELDDLEIASPMPSELILAVNEALERFRSVDAMTISLVELRFFGGMTMEEAAGNVGIPKRNAERLCTYFTTWFRREFKNELTI